MHQTRTYHSKIYRDFRAVDPENHHGIVRFYEKWEDEITRLDFDEYFEMLVAYTQALFRVRAYQKHQIMADVVIMEAMHANIKLYQGEDVFFETLIEKSYSLIYTHRYQKAQHVLYELLKIEPTNVELSKLMKKAKKSVKSYFIKQANACSILLFLLTALVICIDLLVIKNWYLQYHPIFEKMWITMLISGILLLTTSHFYHNWKINQEVRQLIEMLLQRKTKRT